MKGNYFIKLFKTPYSFYLYDIGKNKIFNLDEETFNALDNNLELYNDFTNSLTKHIFNTVHHPNMNQIEYIYSNTISRVTLQLTQNCNLRCSYCPYSASELTNDYLNRSHNSKRMSLETAKKSIDFLLNHSRNSSEVLISFYGGEPILEFNLLKEVVKYSLNQFEGKNVKFYITTNGTLLTNDMIDFLVKHDFILTISLDGPKDINDNNRISLNGGLSSFDSIIKTIEYIRENYPSYLDNLEMSTVLDPKNDFKKIINFFEEFDILKGININASVITDLYRTNEIEFNEDYLIDYNYEKFKILLSKLGYYPKELTSKIISSAIDSQNENLTTTLLQEPDLETNNVYPSSICVPGLGRLFIDVNGNFFICEKVCEESTAVRIGDLETGFNYDNIKKLMNCANLTENKCKKCWGVRFCNSCALSSDNLTELSAKKRLSLCEKSLISVEDDFRDHLLLHEIPNSF